MLALAAFALGSLALLEAVGGVEELRRFVRDAGALGPVLYVGLKALATVLPPVSGTPLRIAAGALFGLPLGVAYTLLGDVIGGVVSFELSRRFGRRILAWFVGRANAQAVDDLADRAGGWRTLLFVRLAVPAVYNYVSYAAGLTQIQLWQYVAVTLFGGILPTIFTVSLGAGATLDRRLLVLIYGGLAGVAVLVFLGRRFAVHRAQAHDPAGGPADAHPHGGDGASDRG